MNAIPTRISFSVTKNHELKIHFTISTGRGGQQKNGETCSGKLGVWFQPLSGASDMLNLMKMAIRAQLHSQHYFENCIMGLQTSGYRAYLEGWHTCTLAN
jgi:hypothetical protein